MPTTIVSRDTYLEKRPPGAEAGGDGQQPASARHQGVWVFVEQVGGKPAPVSWELLGEGARLASDLGVELSGIVLGEGVGDLAREAIAHGADRVYVLDDPVFRDYRTEPYAEGIAELARKYRPEIILMGATTLGRDLAGAVATVLETGLTADCTGLAVDPATRLLKQTRPAFGGNIMATILCKERRPQMATVRPRVMVAPERRPDRQGEIIHEHVDISEDDVATKVLRYIDEPGQAVYLDKAEIIVAGGRGLGEAEGFELLEELAGALGGTLGASRGAVDQKWISAEHQVGQTGITVRPKLYIAVGISGAIQHLVGMQTSDVIVAINTDENAPIFRVATFGIIGDYRRVVPALIEQFRARLAGPRREPERREQPWA